MSEGTPTVCFHCGHATESPEDGPRLNRLEDGRPCPACAERLLADLPSLVGGVAQEMAEVEELEEHSSGTFDEDFLPDEPA